MKLSVLFTTLGALAYMVSAAPSAPKMVSSLSERSSLPRLGGLNIAGCDFGMTTYGYSGTVWCPDQTQFAHFANQGANFFRIPVGWQYLQSSPGSGSLDGSTVSTYTALVDAALATGAYALIDLHNYARWNGGVVGADGPTNAQFAQFWSLIAAKYKDNSRVIFGLMNEPHDLDISVFASACQAAVTAIRAAGATTQTILLPGNSWDTASVWSSGGNAAMLAITDPSSSDKSKLVLDVHKYFDSDGSGSSTTCTNDGTDLFVPLVAYLKAQGRQAMVTEFGGGNNAGCVSYVSSFLKYITDNSDVIVGFTAWSAGAFDSTYALDLTPNTDGSDQLLFTSAIKGYLPGNSGSTSSTSTSAAATSTTTKASTTSTSTTSTSTSTTTTTQAATSTTTQASSCVAASTTSTEPSTTTSANSGSSTCTAAKWAQCGGQGYTGCTSCVSGSTCQYSNDWYSQCL